MELTVSPCSRGSACVVYCVHVLCGVSQGSRNRALGGSWPWPQPSRVRVRPKRVRVRPNPGASLRGGVAVRAIVRVS